jgi:hypothetical protein
LCLNLNFYVLAWPQRIFHCLDEEPRQQGHDWRQQKYQVIKQRRRCVLNRSSSIRNICHTRRARCVKDKGGYVKRQQADADGTDVNYCLRREFTRLIIADLDSFLVASTYPSSDFDGEMAQHGD